eukprot:PhM_4_TR13352/c0_g1_i3/m.92060
MIGGHLDSVQCGVVFGDSTASSTQMERPPSTGLDSDAEEQSRFFARAGPWVVATMQEENNNNNNSNVRYVRFHFHSSSSSITLVFIPSHQLDQNMNAQKALISIMESAWCDSLDNRVVTERVANDIVAAFKEQHNMVALSSEIRLLRATQSLQNEEKQMKGNVDDDAVRKMEEELDLINKSIASIQLELDDFKAREDVEMKAAKKSKKTRLSLEERFDGLRKTSSSTPRPPESNDGMDSGDSSERLLLQQNKAMSDTFLSQCLFARAMISFRRSHLNLIEVRRDTNRYDKRSTSYDFEPLNAEGVCFVQDLTYYLADRAVDVSRKELDYDESFTVLDVLEARLDEHTTGRYFQRPLHLDTSVVAPLPDGGSDVGDQTNWTPLQSPVNGNTFNEGDNAKQETHNKEQSAHVDPTTTTTNMNEPPPLIMPTRREMLVPARRPSAATRHHDLENSDNNYLMRIYDGKKLVPDLVGYLAHGCSMVKHGRHGDPHARWFWVQRSESRIYYRDPATVRRQSQSASKTTDGKDAKFIELNKVTKVVLGQYSKVFARHPAPPRTSTFYLSFSVHYGSSGRTLDVTASNLVDFEAWIIGLSNLCNVQVMFGAPLDIRDDPNTTDLSSKQRQL